MTMITKPKFSLPRSRSLPFPKKSSDSSPASSLVLNGKKKTPSFRFHGKSGSKKRRDIAVVTDDSGSGPTTAPPRPISPSQSYYHLHGFASCANSPLTPLSLHYSANDTLLDLFSTLYQKDQHSTIAYAVGVAFVETALFQIPKHGYYKGFGYEDRRRRSAEDALKVTQLLLLQDNVHGEDLDIANTNAATAATANGHVDVNNKGSNTKETLQKLQTVAQRSFEEAIGETGRPNPRANSASDNNDQDNTTGHVARLWKEYIMDAPDHICSFLTLGCGGLDSMKKTDTNEQQEQEEQEDVEQHSDKQMLIGKELQQLGIHQRHVDGLVEQPPLASSQMFMENDIQESASIETTNYDVSEIAVDKSPPSHDDMKERATNNKTVSETEQHDNDVKFSHDGVGPAVSIDASSIISIVTETSQRNQHQHHQQVESEEKKEDPLDYNSIFYDGTANFDRDDLQLALSLSMSENYHDPNSFNSSSNSSNQQHGFLAPTTPVEKEVSSLSKLYRDQYAVLRDKDKFHVRFLDTFQGRCQGSTNGCTVIAPLTCIQYFTSNDDDNNMDIMNDGSNTNNNVSSATNPTIWHYGLSDDLINHVIDVHAPAVLPTVRNKLGLAPDSFIIPSDVHEHLMEEGLLTTSQFVGVCGGNVMNDDHIAQFKSNLVLEDEREKERLHGKKIAAAFFFHGHVIALHVIQKRSQNNGVGDDDDTKKECGPTDICIELIDSLPNPETWVMHRSSSSSGNSPNQSSDCEEEREPAQVVSRWSDEDDWERPVLQYDDNEDLPQNAVRVRCTDIEHFDTLIRHYAYSKFSHEEQQFIDQNQWDENNSYFDPRVFQAFIWAEA